MLTRIFVIFVVAWSSNLGRFKPLISHHYQASESQRERFIILAQDANNSETQGAMSLTFLVDPKSKRTRAVTVINSL